MTINIGAVAVTFIGLVVGLAGLGLAWRMVRGLSTDDHSPGTDAKTEKDDAAATERDD